MRNPNLKARPKLNLNVKGNQISDIGMLRDFLARKKLERAARGNGNDAASHTQRYSEILLRNQPTTSGNPCHFQTKHHWDLNFMLPRGLQFLV